MNKRMSKNLNAVIRGEYCRQYFAERAEGANPSKKAKHAEAVSKQAKQQERMRSCHVPAVPRIPSTCPDSPLPQQAVSDLNAQVSLMGTHPVPASRLPCSLYMTCTACVAAGQPG